LTLDPNNAGIDVFKPPGKPKENGKSPINGVLKLEKKTSTNGSCSISMFIY
jgi:hypothetical protein